MQVTPNKIISANVADKDNSDYLREELENGYHVFPSSGKYNNIGIVTISAPFSSSNIFFIMEDILNCVDGMSYYFTLNPKQDYSKWI